MTDEENVPRSPEVKRQRRIDFARLCYLQALEALVRIDPDADAWLSGDLDP